MLKNRFILTLISSVAFCSANTTCAAAAGITNIISTTGAVQQQLTHDWYGQAAASPVAYSFSVEEDYLVFYAGQNAPVSIHPDARPGEFQAELWKYDTAEFFISDAAGKNYMEFNLCPNGAWWACAFDGPRKQMAGAGVPDGVETAGSVTANGWVSSARIPLEYLQGLKIDINDCRLATASILNSPDYKYYTTAKDQTKEPDFHLPANWLKAEIRDTSAPTYRLSRNQGNFYGAVQSMKKAGAATPALSWLAILSNPAQVKAMIDTMSGHEYATAMSSQIEGNLGHLRRLRGAMGKGAMLSTPAPAPADAKAAPLASAETDRGWRAGVSVFHEETNVNTDARGTGYDRSETGAMLNAEYVADENLTLGGAISYGRTNLRTDGAMRRHENNTRFDIYAQYGENRWIFASSIGVGIHDHELKRRLGSADADGYSINFMQDAAYTLLSDTESAVQIFGTVESGWNRMDSFHDGIISGAEQDAWATDVTAGLRYNRALPAVSAKAPAGIFTAQAGVTAAIGDIKSGLDLTMNGYTYRQESATRNRWGWQLGVGVDVPVRSNVSVFGTAESILRGDSNSLDGQIGVRVAF